MLRQQRLCGNCGIFGDCESPIKPFSGYNADCEDWVEFYPVAFDDKGEIIFRSNEWKRPRKIFLGSTALRTTQNG
ncbi:MAG: hypothetical protein GXY34_05205 [Syntrophomonadaceae bacterium]|nr:hypothetical protein [Syntrophomonadaceae bacterium]